ncbi:hypothetical protein VQ7734_01470 [Vibrio quintilis]|uniref:Uncharacterized protein n=1 Tax=Vibrio quintilis TaxID=1117707 RepID=A0A1M7YSY1_9VIBR|nr:hypothetical protein VQ7734_01470 [Vibrio quintilis]
MRMVVIGVFLILCDSVIVRSFLMKSMVQGR